MTDYLGLLFMGDGVKCHPQCIIWQHVRLNRNAEESRKVNSMEVYKTNDEISYWILNAYYTSITSRQFT